MKFHKALLVAAFILISGSAAHAFQAPEPDKITKTMAEPGTIALCAAGVAGIWAARKKARSKK
jgi:hypothetical protein